MSAITGDANAGNQRPDVAGVRSDGRVDTVEVASKSQTTAQMDAKGQAMHSKLSPEMRGAHQSVTVKQGLAEGIKPSSGTMVKGVGVAGAGVGIAEAIMAARENPNMSGMEFMYRAAGMYEVAVAAGYLAPPPEMH